MEKFITRFSPNSNFDEVIDDEESHISKTIKIIGEFKSDTIWNGNEYDEDGKIIRKYVNGEEITDWSTDTNPAQNYQCENVNTQCTHRVGSSAYDPSANAIDGYMAEVYFIDGYQCPPSKFGETDSDTGQWKPKNSTVKNYK